MSQPGTRPIVLVHGAYHGAWCWRYVVKRLSDAGVPVEAIELPGHGDDEMSRDVLTLTDYVARVRETLNRITEPVVLVGHSLGGIVISQTAEVAPDELHSLVYVSAFLPKDGDCARSLSASDPDSIIGRHRKPISDTLTTVAEEGLVETFYGLCDSSDVAYARERLVPEPIAILTTEVAVTKERFGQVPKTYIRCEQDRAISPALQDRMLAATPVERVLSLDTDHSPFFSAPRGLSDMLIDLATIAEAPAEGS